MDEDLLHHRQQQQQQHLPPSAIPARLLSPYALVAEGTKLTLLIVAQAMAILLALTMVVDSITCVRPLPLTATERSHLLNASSAPALRSAVTRYRRAMQGCLANAYRLDSREVLGRKAPLDLTLVSHVTFELEACEALTSRLADLEATGAMLAKGPPGTDFKAARSALLSELEGLDKIVSGLAPIADSAEIRCRVAGGEDHSPKDKWRSEAEEALRKIDFEGIWEGVMKNAKS